MRLALLALALLPVSASFAHDEHEARDAVAVVDAFDRAMASGDEATARSLLAPDVLVYEFGAEEKSRDEYGAEHLPADLAFMEKVERKILGRKHDSSGDLAWVATRSRMTGTYKKKAVDLFGTETLVLRRDRKGWKIVHIQWSSQPAGKKAK